MCLLDRGTILIEANDRIRFGSFKVECKPVDENSHRFSSVFLPCLLHIYVLLHKKKRKKKKKERKKNHRSMFLEYILQPFIQRLIPCRGIG